MVTHPDYRNHWKALDEDPRTLYESGIIKRLVGTADNRELYLGITVPKKERLLIFRMPDDWSGDLSKYPRWSGTEIFVHIGEERPTKGKYIAIRQAGRDFVEVYEALIEDICNILLDKGNGSNAEAVLIGRLEKWRSFFQELRQEGLSPEAQQGLFAELYFMHKVLIPAIGAASAVAGWTGPLKASHDFQFQGHALEIKSSSAKMHHKITIANERQLDAKGLDYLDLIFISIDSTNGGEHSLPCLVEAIDSCFEDDPLTRHEFWAKLMDAGYIRAHESNYARTYIVRSIEAFRIADGFPRILESDLRPGVGDVSYTIMISACKRFKVEMSKATADIYKLTALGGRV